MRRTDAAADDGGLNSDVTGFNRFGLAAEQLRTLREFLRYKLLNIFLIPFSRENILRWIAK